MSSSPAATSTSESACHRALRCEEILDQVLQEFVLWDVALRRQSLRNVALTCRAFFHVATAALWSEPPGLWPLYRILIDIPEEFLKISPQWGASPSRPIRVSHSTHKYSTSFVRAHVRYSLFWSSNKIKSLTLSPRRGEDFCTTPHSFAQCTYFPQRTSMRTLRKISTSSSSNGTTDARSYRCSGSSILEQCMAWS